MVRNIFLKREGGVILIISTIKSSKGLLFFIQTALEVDLRGPPLKDRENFNYNPQGRSRGT